MEKHTLMIILFGLTLAFAVTACGDDDKEEADTQSPTDTVEEMTATDTVGGDTTADTMTEDTTGGEDTIPEMTPPPVEPLAPADLIILHTNDLHSHALGSGPFADYSPEVQGNDATEGGYARLAALANAIRDLAGDTPVLFLDGGDFSMGTSLHTLFADEAAELQLMSALGVDVTTIGNHEFDFGSDALAAMLTKASESNVSVQVVSSNLVFSAEDAGDDALEATFTNGLVKPYVVRELSNGLKVGIFGLMGMTAYELAPNAAPVEVQALDEAAQAMVDTLRNDEGVDLVIALSHSGVSEPDQSAAGEDEVLPTKVQGIDVIISGHSHTLLPEPLLVEGTLVVQAGNYGKHLGVLALEVSDGAVDTAAAVESYMTYDVDDEMGADLSMAELVGSFYADVDEKHYSSIDITYDTAVVESPFVIANDHMQESPIGDLVADAIRLGTSAVLPADDPIDVAITAGGVLRAAITPSSAGLVWAEDVFQAVPLGSGPDGSAGYPLVSVYLTADELRQAMEVTTTGAEIVGNTFFLQISGLKYSYDPDGGMFGKVTSMYLGNEKDGYASEPLDTTDTTTLYRVAVSLYLAKMLGTVKDMSFGMLDIVPKDSSGATIAPEDIESALVDADPDTDGLQELKVWQVVMQLLMAMEDTDGDEIPNMDPAYEAPQGRIVTE